MSSNPHSIISLILFGLFFIYLTAFFFKGRSKSKFNYTKLIARSAIFGAISTILYVVPIFNIKLPFLPPFLSLHFDEIPAFIAGYAYGPLTAFVTIFIKTIIKLPFSSTMCVGEIMDLVLSSVFVLSATFTYKKMRNFKGVFLGFAIGLVLQNIAGLLLNIYVMLPFYIAVMGFSESYLLEVCKAANANITDLSWSYGLYCVLPLNLIKDALVLTLTFFIYRLLHKALRFEISQ